MVASIGVIASPSQGVSYYEKDGYYTKDDPAHREASAWAGKGARDLGLSGTVDPGTFQAVLEGRVPDGPHLGKKDKDGEIHHRPGRDVTLSAPKSVSLMALVGGDERIVDAHDRAVDRTLAWVEKNAVETRMQDRATGAMVRAGGQKMVAATFYYGTQRIVVRSTRRYAEMRFVVVNKRVMRLSCSCLPPRMRFNTQDCDLTRLRYDYAIAVESDDGKVFVR